MTDDEFSKLREQISNSIEKWKRELGDMPLVSRFGGNGPPHLSATMRHALANSKREEEEKLRLAAEQEKIAEEKRVQAALEENNKREKQQLEEAKKLQVKAEKIAKAEARKAKRAQEKIEKEENERKRVAAEAEKERDRKVAEAEKERTRIAIEEDRKKRSIEVRQNRLPATLDASATPTLTVTSNPVIAVSNEKAVFKEGAKFTMELLSGYQTLQGRNAAMDAKKNEQVYEFASGQRLATPRAEATQTATPLSAPLQMRSLKDVQLAWEIVQTPSSSAKDGEVVAIISTYGAEVPEDLNELSGDQIKTISNALKSVPSNKFRRAMCYCEPLEP